MENKVNIKIQLGDVKHPLTVKAEDEPIYREAARIVNERVEAYSTKYRGANLPRDFMMSFAALDIAAQLVSLQRNETYTGDIEANIQTLIDQIRAYMQ